MGGLRRRGAEKSITCTYSAYRTRNIGSQTDARGRPSSIHCFRRQQKETEAKRPCRGKNPKKAVASYRVALHTYTVFYGPLSISGDPIRIRMMCRTAKARHATHQTHTSSAIPLFKQWTNKRSQFYGPLQFREGSFICSSVQLDHRILLLLC